mmetsp:Transcript_52412/g.138987  ORF Transcript_52412/g.138987 Transcript_52412/m.138987 type:complete len:290 (-) Transcript_52412:614-1483(-)
MRATRTQPWTDTPPLPHSAGLSPAPCGPAAPATVARRGGPTRQAEGTHQPACTSAGWESGCIPTGLILRRAQVQMRGDVRSSYRGTWGSGGGLQSRHCGVGKLSWKRIGHRSPKSRHRRSCSQTPPRNATACRQTRALLPDQQPQQKRWCPRNTVQRPLARRDPLHRHTRPWSQYHQHGAQRDPDEAPCRQKTRSAGCHCPSSLRHQAAQSPIAPAEHPARPRPQPLLPPQQPRPHRSSRSTTPQRGGLPRAQGRGLGGYRTAACHCRRSQLGRCESPAAGQCGRACRD